MLKLLIFAPCEKAIVSDSGQSSIIGVIEMVQVAVKPDEPLPVDALIPFRWGFLTLWTRDEEVDQPVRYQEQIRIIRPDGTDTGFEANSEFVVQNKFQNFRQHSSLVIPAFPGGQEGTYQLKLFLRRVGEENWEERGMFPVTVKHVESLPQDKSDDDETA